MTDPGGPTPIDLRAILANRAVELGVAAERITLSTWCTLCGGSPFFSHRRGDTGRQVGFLGILPLGS
jgi:copper oxidase (laccase) domain-containing protein